MQYMYVIL